MSSLEKPNTPVCLCCGAKHSHSKAEANCKKCGIPDEIVSMGPQMVARWKRKTYGKKRVIDRDHSHKKEIAQIRKKKVITFPAPNKRRNKHGRKGAKA